MSSSQPSAISSQPSTLGNQPRRGISFRRFLSSLIADCRLLMAGSYWLLAASCWLLISGCVHQSLTIRTEPPGAQVYVNDELKGVSPVTYDFQFYGWQRVTLRKEGFRRVDEERLLKAPFYLWIPLDLAMELMPFPVGDTHTWSYTLRPAEPLETPTPPVIPPSPVRTKKPTRRTALPLPIGTPQPSVPADHDANTTSGAVPSTMPPSTTEPQDATR